MNARMHRLIDVRAALSGLMLAEKAAHKASVRYARAKPGAAKAEAIDQVKATEAERQLCFLKLRWTLIEAGLSPDPTAAKAA